MKKIPAYLFRMLSNDTNLSSEMTVLYLRPQLNDGNCFTLPDIYGGQAAN